MKFSFRENIEFFLLSDHIFLVYTADSYSVSSPNSESESESESDLNFDFDSYSDSTFHSNSIIFTTISDYKISRFGHAAVQSGVCPDEAIMLYEDLSRALNGMNLESDLHLLYLITPQEKGLYPDFQVFFSIYLQGRFFLFFNSYTLLDNFQTVFLKIDFIFINFRSSFILQFAVRQQNYIG